MTNAPSQADIAYLDAAVARCAAAFAAAAADSAFSSVDEVSAIYRALSAALAETSAVHSS